MIFLQAIYSQYKLGSGTTAKKAWILGPSLPGTFHILIGFVIRFLNQIFFVINFSYFVIRFLLNSSIVKSDNELGKANDKKNLI